LRPSSKNKNRKPPKQYELRWFQRSEGQETWTEMRARLESYRLQRFYMPQRVWDEILRVFNETRQQEEE
jgi:hypothetical protein